MANIKVRVVSVVTEGLGGLWSLYSTITTAADLPKDAGELLKMMADPPIYLPWLITAVSFLALAYAFWPSGKKPGGQTAFPPPPPPPPPPSQDHPDIDLGNVGKSVVKRNTSTTGRRFIRHREGDLSEVEDNKFGK